MWTKSVVPILCIGATATGMSCIANGESEIMKDTAQSTATALVFGDPLPGLSESELARFRAGLEEFSATEEPADGLGPVFNDTGCGQCHTDPAIGGGSTILEQRVGTIVNGKFDPLARAGGSLIQSNGIGQAGDCTFRNEQIPAGSTIVAKRRTTPLFGFGLVDALPESTLIALRDSQAANSPRQAGVLNMVRDIRNNRLAVGRFGWKDHVPNLHQFSGDAYVNEMGITSPEFPTDNCPQGDCAALARCNPTPGINDELGEDVQLFEDFMTFLAPPPALPLDARSTRGRTLFNNIGCQTCHVANLTTGPNPSRALDRVTFHPYSDFLLHDMGTMGDGITQDGATGTLMRTAPLWGLRAIKSFLHDGSAFTVEQAIVNHLGQGREARDAFTRLSTQDRQDVLAFLNTL
ncbi:di-heme oxidoredictase family protein [Pendulispora albinea]|uniref:Cytochrome c domain-containing protein n=1 Tax=Pendulispora albinea TaxID=2741071 RepID=A0ABZ2LUB0_9BACT